MLGQSGLWASQNARLIFRRAENPGLLSTEDMLTSAKLCICVKAMAVSVKELQLILSIGYRVTLYQTSLDIAASRSCTYEKLQRRTLAQACVRSLAW